MRATDLDQDRPETKILYSLSGYLTTGADKKFEINQNTGEIFLIGKLDREDPKNGNPTFIFTVAAEDERINGQIGYATVKVTPNDINDKPSFEIESLKGTVEEHSAINCKLVSYLSQVRIIFIINTIHIFIIKPKCKTYSHNLL